MISIKNVQMIHLINSMLLPFNLSREQAEISQKSANIEHGCFSPMLIWDDISIPYCSWFYVIFGITIEQRRHLSDVYGGWNILLTIFGIEFLKHLLDNAQPEVQRPDAYAERTVLPS